MADASSPAPILLRTKLQAPLSRAPSVPRVRLDAALERGLDARLTLVCAGAGFGKTTLVRDWLQRQQFSAGWLSLDRRDDEPTTLLRYIIAASAAAAPTVGEALFRLAELSDYDAQLLAIEAINLWAHQPGPIVLVLDDLHLIESQPSLEGLAFLLNSGPEQLRIFATARHEPQLPLSRLRAHGLLNEIRGQELRFVAEETEQFLTHTMQLPLAANLVKKLEERTEGWAAGLQLAALSLRGRTDTARQVEAFAGSHRFILDYLLEEVLEQMPSARRDFLLETSILPEFDSSLIQEITGRDDAAPQLAALDRDHLFVVALDSHRNKYRYHHLFAELLTHELGRQRGPEAVTTLHRRAAAAFLARGRDHAAFEHALTAEDYDLAEQAYLRHCDRSRLSGNESQCYDLLKAMPRMELSRRPAMLVKRLWSVFDDASGARIRTCIAEAEAALQVHSHPAALAEMQLFVAIFRLYRGEFDEPRQLLQEALAGLPETEGYARNYALIGLAHCELALGHGARCRELVHAATQISSGGSLELQQWTVWWSSIFLFIEGQISQSELMMQRTLADASALYGEVLPRNAAFVFVVLADIAYIRGDLDEAATFMERGLELCDLREQAIKTCELALSNLRIEALRSSDRATYELARANVNHLQLDGVAHQFAARIAAMEVELALHPRSKIVPEEVLPPWLAQAENRERTGPLFQNMVCECQFRPGYADFVLARALLWNGEFETAEALLRELLQRAQTAGRTICQVECMLALFEIHLGRDCPEQTNAWVQEAINMAAKERIASPFMILPPEAFDFALAVAKASHAHELVACLNKIAPPVIRGTPAELGSVQCPPPHPAPSSVLSERELSVLELVAQGHSNAEIGRRLYIAVSTVKKHLENVYDKLGVRRRMQAVAAARKSGILSASD